MVLGGGQFLMNEVPLYAGPFALNYNRAAAASIVHATPQECRDVAQAASSVHAASQECRHVDSAVLILI